MRERINAFLSNESSFGKLMTKLGIIIGANLMFVLFSLPVLTLGAGWAALCHVMLKTLRGDGVLNPFKQFWLGFRANFKQATVVWLLTLALGFLGWLDVRFLLHQGGAMVNFRYAVYAVGLVLLIGVIYIFPVMAAFANKLPVLFRSAYYFALKNPLKLIVLLFFHVFPLYLTYTDAQMLPLYAFLWTFFGFGAIAMLTAKLLLPLFTPLLPLVDEAGDFILDDEGKPLMPGDEDRITDSGVREKTEQEILEEMKKLGM
ncbi:MAG: DUF624 domain-containing protein [Oscillospiraceae bacterium]|nr:DUF624 domain-containing protein [Oscillospiraceae bacterium]